MLDLDPIIFNLYKKLFSVFWQLKGSIDDCGCSIDTVDFFNNNKIHPRLQSLLVRDYFRFYKVNLRKECPFWSDDSKCAMRSCHVSTCEEKDIPEGLKGQHQQESFVFKVNSISYMQFLFRSTFTETINFAIHLFHLIIIISQMH